MASTKSRPALEQTVSSSASNQNFTSYALNTNQGLVRPYNEDRATIILHIKKPPFEHINVSYFAIYDGHAGSNCANFLKEYLHTFIVSESCFFTNPKQAIYNGFQQAEKIFLQEVQKKLQAQNCSLDNSGSCAIVLLIIDKMCYIANVGDSRAVYSLNQGRRTLNLSIDHKPNNSEESMRIAEAGGSITQERNENFTGPYRIQPGGLSVSRAFGDIKAKLKCLGGNKNVLISRPDIREIEINDNSDFILLGSDGIFDKMDSYHVVQQAWQGMRQAQNQNRQLNIHELGCKGVEGILNEAFNLQSQDNVTVLMVGFQGLERDLFKQTGRQLSKQMNSLIISEMIDEMPKNKKMNQIHCATTKSIKQLNLKLESRLEIKSACKEEQKEFKICQEDNKENYCNVINNNFQ